MPVPITATFQLLMGTLRFAHPTVLDRYDAEGPQHEVTIPTLFMGKFPITLGLIL